MTVEKNSGLCIYANWYTNTTQNIKMERIFLMICEFGE